MQRREESAVCSNKLFNEIRFFRQEGILGTFHLFVGNAQLEEITGKSIYGIARESFIYIVKVSQYVSKVVGSVVYV